MATLDNLTTLYRNVHRLPASVELPTSAATQLTLMAQGIDIARSGQQAGDIWSYASAARWIQDSAKATTQVAVMSYGFLADLSLSNIGVDYLVAANGGNPNNLSSAAFAPFNTVNRYINFAVSLVKNGDAKDAFIRDYGANGTAFDTFTKAYFKLFGVHKTQTEAFEMLNEEVPNGRGGTYTRGEFFAEAGGDGGNGLGMRAAMVGWLMAVAAHEQKGPYFEAMRAYLADLGLDGKAEALSVFMSVYGPGGEYASDGPSDPGLPGEKAKFEHDWNVDAANHEPAHDTHLLASDGNDMISPVMADQGGLDAGRHIRTGGGNDMVRVDNGVMRGLIDTGTGNDILLIEKFDGRIITGSGYDSIDLGAFAPMHLVGGKAADIAVIEDFQKGFDTLGFPGFVGPGEKKQLAFVATATFDDALQAYAGGTAANSNTVFEWNGDTYVFHQNAVAGLDAGDGLIRLAGVTGLTVGKGEGSADIVFMA
jgi:hypothetical protein